MHPPKKKYGQVHQIKPMDKKSLTLLCGEDGFREDFVNRLPIR